MKADPLHRPRGQDLAEFALTLPILMLLMLGIIDLGRVVYYYSSLQNAVREGARYGIIAPDRIGLIDGVVRAKAVALDPARLIAYEPYNPDGVLNDPDEKTLTVRYEYRFTPVTPMIDLIIRVLYELDTDYLKLTASSTMYHEY